MVDVVITKENEAFLRLRCDDGIARDISEYFTFQVPNFQFHPMFKKKRNGRPIWDGKKRLFNLRDHSIYFGLLDKIIEFCNDRSLTYELDFELDTTTDLTEDFVKTLGIPSHFELRDYQLDSVFTMSANKKRLLLSPTSSGKSLILYILLRYLLEIDSKKVLIVVPRIQLVHQLMADFDEYGWDSKSNVHSIFGGQDKESKKKVYISTWQSLQNLPKEYFHQFDAVICDESHEGKAAELSRILESCINAIYRLGMTGTLDDTLCHKIVLEGLFGKVIRFVTTRELMDRGQVSNLVINAIVLGYPDIMKKEIKGAYVKKTDEDTKQKVSMENYNQEIKFLVNNKKRNLFIASLACSRKGNTLVTFQFVKGDEKPHGQLLYDLIAKYGKDKKVFFIHGETPVEEREEIRKLVEKENNIILVASSGVFAMGINMKNIHHIILASPSKAKIKLLQTIGRGLRLLKGKVECVLYDIADDLRIGKHTNFTLKHFEERISIYNQEQFEYTIKKVDIT